MRKLALILSFVWALPVGASGSLGDMNGDGKVNLADCVYLLGYLFGGGTPPVPCASCWYGDLGRGDVNGDSKTNLGDAIWILGYLFAGGPAPGPCPSCYPCEPCRLPATGIAKCYDPDKGEIPCDDPQWPGQDGYYRKSCGGPGRFVDNGDGTVTDSCTGLMWQKHTEFPHAVYDPDEYGHVHWDMALKYCDELELAGYTDWRLPNALEFVTLISQWGTGPAALSIDEIFRDRHVPVNWSGYGAWDYWISSYWECYRNEVGVGNMYGGCCQDVRGGPHLGLHFVLCVRGGTSGPCESCLPDTGITTCYDPPEPTGLIVPAPCDIARYPGQDGAYLSGRPRRGRFYDRGDGTVVDAATGLMWFKEPPMPPTRYDPNEEGAVIWQQALKYCEELEFAGYSDWRLPNLFELFSIMTVPAVELFSEETPPFRLKWRAYWTSSARPIVYHDGRPGADVYIVHRCTTIDSDPAYNRALILPVRDAYWR